ncbi:MAG TPA: glycerophosphodiester phosphodiesterase [Thermoanaerobaculia bacterium]|nr:glycerophosphodiester phosphodiesterase [Thermoanaerobaculia bacterium]
MNFFRSGVTRVVGHRGSPTKALENTLESFDRAEADGADGFELDVRLTLDGEAVVHHDAEIVLAGRRVPLATVTIAELAELPVARGEFRGFVPTLRDLFLRYGPAGRFLVELKPGPAPRPGLLEFRVAALLAQMHLFERALVLSFSSDMLRRIREIEPRIETCLNYDATARRPEGALWPDLPKGCGAIAPQAGLVTDELFARAKAEGLAVHCWTVNDPEFAKQLARLGAASVISDDVSLVGPAIREVTGAAPPLELLKA